MTTSAHDAAYAAYIYLQLRHHADRAGDPVAAQFALVQAMVVLRDYVNAYFIQKAAAEAAANAKGPLM